MVAIVYKDAVMKVKEGESLVQKQERFILVFSKLVWQNEIYLDVFINSIIYMSLTNYIIIVILILSSTNIDNGHDILV